VIFIALALLITAFDEPAKVTGELIEGPGFPKVQEQSLRTRKVV
jgi:hypothetical protein